MSDSKNRTPRSHIYRRHRMHSQSIIELEQAMLPVKAAMQARGLNICLEKLDSLINKINHEKSDIESNLRSSLGIKGEINFNSSKDIAVILSAALGVKLLKSRSGRFITNRQVLQNFNNPLTETIAQYRNLQKILSSLTAVYGATDKAEAKLSCIYTDDCPSGRLYTKNYNIQGIGELCRGVVYPDEGCSFILADYDSFELRILSALAHDTYFKDCWSKGLDLHRKVVSDMKGIPYESVTAKERKLGKCLNFGLAYGQEPHGLARNLRIPVSESSKLMAGYKNKIPKIEEFKRESIRSAHITGYTKTYYGRKRLLPEILSSNLLDAKKAERQVINTKIQGTGADIVKFSLVKLHNAGFKIDTMLHDGILITVSDDKVDSSIQKIREIMEIEIEGMKFTTSIKTGKTWGQCHQS